MLGGERSSAEQSLTEVFEFEQELAQVEYEDMLICRIFYVENRTLSALIVALYLLKLCSVSSLQAEEPIHKAPFSNHCGTVMILTFLSQVSTSLVRYMNQILG